MVNSPSVFVTASDYLAEYGTTHAVTVTNWDNPTATVVNMDFLERRVSDANAIIAAYVHRLNLRSVPKLLKVIGVRLVNRLLHIYEVPPAVEAEGNWAYSMLRDIASGRIRLEESDGSEAPSQASPRNFNWGGGDFIEQFRLWRY